MRLAQDNDAVHTFTPDRYVAGDCENLQDCWVSAIQLDKEPAITVREAGRNHAAYASRQSTDVEARRSQPQAATST
jgi:hypothetical protein